MDSVVLLHLVWHAGLGRPLRALHVNHGIHPNATHWAAHCASMCHRWNVPFAVENAAVALRGDGLEAALRVARYAIFETALQPGETLLLAHHQDDQAETFLFRALRASGVDGLSAIPVERVLGQGRLLRPLLDVDRASLHAYALAHGLEWMDDPANADDTFDRNFVRHRVLPLLRERWPHASAALARSAELCARDAALLEAEDSRALASAATLDANVIRRDVLAALPSARRARVLRHWVAALDLPPLPRRVLDEIDAVLMLGRADAQPRVAWSTVTLRVWRDLLHVGPTREALPEDWSAPWNGDEPLALPGGGILLLDGARSLPVPCTVHARQGGERITLPGRSHSHVLKHVLQDLAVPPWTREQLPLVSSTAGDILAAGDLVYSQAFDVWLREHGARLRWMSDSSTPGSRPAGPLPGTLPASQR